MRPEIGRGLTGRPDHLAYAVGKVGLHLIQDGTEAPAHLLDELLYGLELLAEAACGLAHRLRIAAELLAGGQQAGDEVTRGGGFPACRTGRQVPAGDLHSVHAQHGQPYRGVERVESAVHQPARRSVVGHGGKCTERGGGDARVQSSGSGTLAGL